MDGPHRGGERTVTAALILTAPMTLQRRGWTRGKGGMVEGRARSDRGKKRSRVVQPLLNCVVKRCGGGSGASRCGSTWRGGGPAYGSLGARAMASDGSLPLSSICNSHHRHCIIGINI
jgi:hypothetical protein